MVPTDEIAEAEPEIPPFVWRILDGRPQVELSWLDPDEAAEVPRARVRGRARVMGRDVERVVQAVRAALRTADRSALCFDPEYGVRLEAGGEVAELRFCFPCGNVEVIGPDGSEGVFPAGAGPQRLFRRLLRAAGAMPWWRFWG